MYSIDPYVIESIGRGPEKSYSLYSRLLKDRIIYVQGEIEEYMANSVSAQLMYLDQQEEKPIIMFINSPGGSVTDGLSIYDSMRFVESKIITVGVGQCCSMGSFLLSMGDVRLSFENTSLMYHSVSSGFHGTVQDYELDFLETKRLQDLLVSKLKEKTLPEYHSEFDKKIERNWWVLPEKAVEIGLIDKIITKKSDIKQYL
jgi:ATP-dependent Clp protease protease subunit